MSSTGKGSHLHNGNNSPFSKNDLRVCLVIAVEYVRACSEDQACIANKNIFKCLSGNVFLFALKRIYIVNVKKLLIKVAMIIYCKE